MSCPRCTPPAPAAPAWPSPPAAPAPYGNMREVYVPALTVPAAAIPVDEAESVSVRMLRQTLDARRVERDGHKSSKADLERQVEQHTARIADLTTHAATHGALIDKATEEIATILADIKALGGADEPAPVKK